MAECKQPKLGVVELVRDQIRHLRKHSTEVEVK